MATGRAAQPDELTLPQALTFCGQLDDAAEKLACYEALEDQAGAPIPRRSDVKTGLVSPAPDGQRDETAGAAGEKFDEKSGKRRGLRLPLFGRRDDQQTIEVTEKESEEEPRYVIKRSDDPEIKRNKREEYSAVVYKSWRNGAGELRIAFRNGEIWRQIEQNLDHNPQPGETVVFRPRTLGGWFAYFEAARFTIPMKQVTRR